MGNYNNTAGSSDLTPSSINNKYIDRYTAYDSTKYGDALYETSTSASGITSWYSDYSNMLEASYPWFGRGGHYDSGSIAGAFCFYSNTGAAGSNYSWRSVVLTSEGL
jgi:hypothetical protein